MIRTHRSSHASVALVLQLLLGLVTGFVFAPAVSAQTVPVIETRVAFDSAGRISVMTPTLVARLQLSAPTWPVLDAFTEARLFRVETIDSAHVLVVQRVDGAVARYALSTSAVASLRTAVHVATVALGARNERFVSSGTSFDVSQPAGNAFARNQALLGLVAYGPAAAALFSETSGPAAGGAYFLAAGASFFVAANIAKSRSVTRAQASRAGHGGTRGAITGLGIAAIADAEGGPAWGAAVLAGSIGGSIAGFQQARGLSDGEAGSAGLFADLAAITTLGVGGGAGAFKGRRETIVYDINNPQFGSYTRTDNSLRGPGRAVVGTAIAAQAVGYALGPRYAQRASYNVTAGDADMVFTSAVLGAAAFGAIASDRTDRPVLWGAAAAGLLGGALFGDRVFVRTADRTGADGTLARLGAVAGALMGAGFAAMANADGRVAVGLASGGGLLGLLAADNIIAPARDAGPLRGVMKSAAHRTDDRFTLNIGPVTSVRFAF